MRTAPAQNRDASEDGFILIEVLVSALILAIVAAGVMAILSSTTHSAASERVRSQAAGLAQEDQARLRTLRISTLQRLEETKENVVLDGTKFTVRSLGTFVGSATNEVVCSGESSATDYVRITSSVTGPGMQTPVVLQSMVSPSNGSLDQNHGTLSFNAKNAKGLPLSGVSISGTGPGSFSGKTDSTGCANFADLPAGNYNVTTSAVGMINMKGETTTTKEYGAPSAATQTVALTYDSPGGIEPTFVYRVGSTGTFLAGRADSIEVYNGETGELARTFGTPGGTRLEKIEAKKVFPFKSKTTVYAGSCESNNPDPKEEKPANRAAMAFVDVPAGGVLPAVIQLPALNLTVTAGGVPVAGARVTITETSPCGIKRVYSTNSSGNLIDPVSLKPDAGMPWGGYRVCASIPSGTRFRKETVESVAVENLASGTPLSLALPTTTSSSAC